LRSSLDAYNKQKINSLSSLNGKTHGYPNFYEPTPNVQTRLPETRNVMEKALERYEQNLCDA